MPTIHQKTYHQPVLTDQVLKFLAPESDESYLDLTAGYGGHAKAVLERTKNFRGSVLIDRDLEATQYLSQLFGDSGIEILQKDFLTASRELLAAGLDYGAISD